MRGVCSRVGDAARRAARRSGLILVLLIVGLIYASPALADGQGCRPDVEGKIGAQVTAQVLRPGQDGRLTAVGPSGTEVAARAGDTVRLSARPVDGTFQPAGPDCPIRVSVGKLLPVGRLATRSGFVLDERNAYALVAPGGQLALDVEINPFGEWDAAPDQIGVEDATVHLPDVREFAERLPAPFRPPSGTICVDVVDTDAGPAVGTTVGLAMPADGPRDTRAVGPTGRVCWDGLDPTRYGEVSLQAGATPALGLPKARYVSAEASYRLFVVKRAGTP